MSAEVWVPGVGYCKIVCKACGEDAHAGHVCPAEKRPDAKQVAQQVARGLRLPGQLEYGQ